MWLKFSNNNRGNTSYELLKEAIDDHIDPLQVRGEKGSENRLIAKNTVMVRNAQFKGHVGGRSTWNTRIEYFWRENNVNEMVHFRDVFRKLEALRHLDSDYNTDIWSLYYVLVHVIDQEIDKLTRHYDQHPLSTTGHKSTCNLWITSSFNNQVIKTVLDTETINRLSELQTYILFLSMEQ